MVVMKVQWNVFVGANGWAVGYRAIEGGDTVTKPVFNVRKLKKKDDSNGGSLKWTAMVVVQEPNEHD